MQHIGAQSHRERERERVGVSGIHKVQCLQVQQFHTFVINKCICVVEICHFWCFSLCTGQFHAICVKSLHQEGFVYMHFSSQT